jgi:hypothetical protein
MKILVDVPPCLPDVLQRTLREGRIKVPQAGASKVFLGESIVTASQ